MINFKNIKMVGIDEDATARSSSEDGFHEVTIRLSAVPPHDWRRKFETYWKQHLYTDKRNAAVWSDGRLVIACPLQDLSSHKSELAGIITRVNEWYWSHLHQKDQEAARTMADHERRRAEVAAFAKTVTFD